MLKLLMEDVDVDVVVLPLLIIVNSHAKICLSSYASLLSSEFCFIVLFQFYHVEFHSRMIIGRIRFRITNEIYNYLEGINQLIRIINTIDK